MRFPVMRHLSARQRAFLIFLMGVAATGVLLLLIFALTTSATKTSEIRETQLEGTPIGKKLVKSSDRLLDCTEPGDGKSIPAGECYTRSQKQLARTITQITAGNVVAVVCALEVPDATPFKAALRRVSRCVANQLGKP